jgi:hypothetical protein
VKWIYSRHKQHALAPTVRLDQLRHRGLQRHVVSSLAVGHRPLAQQLARARQLTEMTLLANAQFAHIMRHGDVVRVQRSEDRIDQAVIGTLHRNARHQLAHARHVRTDLDADKLASTSSVSRTNFSCSVRSGRCAIANSGLSK